MPGGFTRDMAISPSMLSLSRRTASASPGSTVVLFLAGFSRELEMTYFGTSLTYVAIGSSVLSGQVRRPLVVQLASGRHRSASTRKVGTHRRGSGR